MKLKVIIEWLLENGFVDTTETWKQRKEHGLMFYSYKKNDYRIEIRENWNKKYGDTYGDITLTILNCKNEVYSDDGNGYIGWMGQNTLIALDNPKSITLLNEILKHWVK